MADWHAWPDRPAQGEYRQGTLRQQLRWLPRNQGSAERELGRRDIGPKLTDSEKYAIIEYLKDADYNNYPTERRKEPAKVVCAEKPDWARSAQSEQGRR